MLVFLSGVLVESVNNNIIKPSGGLYWPLLMVELVVAALVISLILNAAGVEESDEHKGS
jgi:hypothetical protein